MDLTIHICLVESPQYMERMVHVLRGESSHMACRQQRYLVASPDMDRTVHILIIEESPSLERTVNIEEILAV